MNYLEAVNKEAILIGIEPLRVGANGLELDKFLLADIERICLEMHVKPDELDNAFFLNKTGKFADNNSDYVKAFGKINSTYISSIILCLKKYQIEQNKRIKEVEPPKALQVSKEFEKEALKRGFELAKENLLKEYANGKDKYQLATKWMHPDYYQFFKNNLNQKEKFEYLEKVKDLVRQNKIKEYQMLYEAPIPREQNKYVKESMGKVENYAKCLWMTEEILKELK